MTAKSRNSKSRNSHRPSSAPRSTRPQAADVAAPAQDADHTPMTEEHSEIVLREPRSTRPGTGDDPNEAPPTQRGVGLTVHDKSLRPSVLRWKSWEVSDAFRRYAERAARGEKLPRFEGSILADPSRMLPMPSPDQSETSRRRAYGIKSPRPSLMDPNSLLWNPWLWAASATVFALGLFSFTLWYTAPRDEVVWETNALTPAPRAPLVIARPLPEPSIDPRELAAAEEPLDTSAATRAIEPATPPSPPPPRVTPPAATAQRAPAPPAIAAPPLAATAASVVKAEPSSTAVAPLAKAAPVDRSAAQLDGSLNKGTAAYPVPSEPLPDAPAPAETAPAASAVEETDPLLVEAPSF
jgi:hypothetical protein